MFRQPERERVKLIQKTRLYVLNVTKKTTIIFRFVVLQVTVTQLTI